jgi:glycyl-tRNA synthetase
LRAAEAGTMYCITIDYETLEKQPETVTLRDRDTEKQVRVEVGNLRETLRKLFSDEMKFDEL